MNRIKCSILVISCFVVMGCAPLVFFGAGTAAGVVGYKFYQGSLTVIFQAPFMDTWDATLKAVEQMNMKVEHSFHDVSTGKITAKQADNKSVKISLKYKSAQETEVVIRVGHLGDRNRSIFIKEEIRKALVAE